MYTGTADLPLHDGHVPPWMANYMKKLALAISEVVIELYGPNKLVELLSDPIWFQALNNAIGMDWDSSGSTTVTLGILKQVLNRKTELGIVIAGGKGRKARDTPRELAEYLDKQYINTNVVEEAIYASKLSAKTDNVLLQDGYQLYHHVVVLSAEGKWAIVQQGMNLETRYARRYHWLSPLPPEPSLEPHNAIAGSKRHVFVIDTTSRISYEARRAIVDIAREKPRKTLQLVLEAYRELRGVRPITQWIENKESSNLQIDTTTIKRFYSTYYRPQPTPPRKIEEILNKIYEENPRSIEELVLIEGVGPGIFRSLVLVAELVYKLPVSHKDPVNTPIDPFRYAYIVGGKDAVPFPYRPDYAEKVIEFLKNVVRDLRVDEKTRRKAIERLEKLSSIYSRGTTSFSPRG